LSSLAWGLEEAGVKHVKQMHQTRSNQVVKLSDPGHPVNFADYRRKLGRKGGGNDGHRRIYPPIPAAEKLISKKTAVRGEEVQSERG